MKDLFHMLGGGIAAVVLFCGLIVGATAGSIWLYKTFGPQAEAARTEVYRNTKSYVEGTIRDLRRLQREYETSDESAKQSLRTIILQRSDEVDLDQMPRDVVRFIEKVRGNS